MIDDPDTPGGEPTTADEPTSDPPAGHRRARPSAASEDEAVFTLERLLGADGPKIVGSSLEDDTIGASNPGVIAGAFHGEEDPEAEFTRGQIRERVEAFLEHEDETEREPYGEQE